MSNVHSRLYIISARGNKICLLFINGCLIPTVKMLKLISHINVKAKANVVLLIRIMPIYLWPFYCALSKIIMNSDFLKSFNNISTGTFSRIKTTRTHWMIYHIWFKKTKTKSFHVAHKMDIIRLSPVIIFYLWI